MPLRSEAAGFAIALALSFGAAIASAPAAAADRPASVRMLVQDSPLAGFRHAEAGAVWLEVRAGDVVALVREPDNPFDENAVRVEWRGRKLGYVPRRDNSALAWALDRGEVLHARISRAEWHPNPARRIAFQVFVE
jgi:hypothetical protein